MKDLTLQTAASGDTSRGPTQQGATHTPGPWHTTENPRCMGAGRGDLPFGLVVDSENHVVAEIRTTCNSQPNREANARLIAQSPALLAALKALLLEDSVCHNPYCKTRAELMAQAHAAILAAEGSDRP